MGWRWGAVVAVVAMSCVADARAGTITVGSTSNAAGAAGCTLRDAIASANAGADQGTCTGATVEPNTIGFDLPAGSIIELNAAGSSGVLPEITSDLTIDGPGRGALTVGSATAASVPFQIFRINGATVTISGLTARGMGLAIGAHQTEAAIAASATTPGLTLHDVAVTGNTKSNSGSGVAYAAGVYFAGTGGVLAIDHTDITDNSVTQGSGSRLIGAGLGTNATGSTVTISDSVIARNTATITTANEIRGGGTGFGSSGTATIERSHIEDNAAAATGGGTVSGVGLYSGSSVAVTDTAITGNHTSAHGTGGGLFVAAADEASLLRTTVAGNTADSAAGTRFGSLVTRLVDTTIAANAANHVSVDPSDHEGVGGAAVNAAGLELSNVTIVGNTTTAQYAAGGAELESAPGDPPTEIANSVIAANTRAGGVAADCEAFSGTVVLRSGGFNLVGAPGDCTWSGDTTTNLPADTDPQLHALANNGGHVPTMAPTSTSPLLAAGNPVAPGSSPACSNLSANGAQRFLAGPTPPWAGCDIGAYEEPRTAITAATTGDAGAGTVTSPSADGQIDCAAGGTGECTGHYLPGTSLTLTQATAAGKTFYGWTGITGTGDTCTTTSLTCAFSVPSTATTVTANWSPLPVPPAPSAPPASPGDAGSGGGGSNGAGGGLVTPAVAGVSVRASATTSARTGGLTARFAVGGTCEAATPCPVVATFTAPSAPASSTRAAAKTTLARRAFTIPAGERRTVTVTTSAAGQRALLAWQRTIAARAGKGNPVPVTGTVVGAATGAETTTDVSAIRLALPYAAATMAKTSFLVVDPATSSVAARVRCRAAGAAGAAGAKGAAELAGVAGAAGAAGAGGGKGATVCPVAITVGAGRGAATTRVRVRSGTRVTAITLPASLRAELIDARSASAPLRIVTRQPGGGQRVSTQRGRLTVTRSGPAFTGAR